MKRKLSLSLALTAAMVLSFACSSGPVRAYPGAERPAAELATVSLSPREPGLTIGVVDGQEVGSRIHDVHVLPGRHTFLVKASRRIRASSRCTCRTRRSAPSPSRYRRGARTPSRSSRPASVATRSR